jgi:Zn-dependent protease with chaperone function
MDFFSAQDEARKNTKWLVLLFTAAVVAMIALLYGVAVFMLSYANTASAAESIQWWQPRLFMIIAGVTAAVILLGSLYKTMTLASGGGAAVAESLGGRLITRDTRERLERRLLNVVDEMAIASGVPVPQVYLLEHEPSINAFAAGYDMQHAVVAVTRGCLEQLSRDELQGVVAHEFSHILNGDMRINIRLIGILHGILLLALAGRMVLRGSHRGRSRNGGGIVAVGLALMLVGYVGLFFGRLLKAAVSRQREYLADAAGVQFTRNPSGLAGALKKIGGFLDNTIEHPNAEEASHMFFDSGVVMHLNLFATHPPLEERIKRIEPMFRGERKRRVSDAQAVGGGAAMGLAGEEAIGVTPDAVRESVGNSDERHLDYAQGLLARVPEPLREDAHNPLFARAVVYSLLAAPLAQPHEALAEVLKGEELEVRERSLQHLAACAELARSDRLPLIELAIPAISELDGNNSARLLECINVLIERDSRVTVFEYAVLSLLEHALGERRRHRGARHGNEMKRLREDSAVVLSLLAHAGHRQQAAAEQAFSEAAQRLPIDGVGELLPRQAIPLPRFSEALARLDTLKFRFKAGIIEACVAAIAADGKVTVTEAELLRAVGARLDCPIPPMLPGSLEG